MARYATCSMIDKSDSMAPRNEGDASLFRPYGGDINFHPRDEARCPLNSLFTSALWKIKQIRDSKYIRRLRWRPGAWRGRRNEYRGLGVSPHVYVQSTKYGRPQTTSTRCALIGVGGTNGKRLKTRKLVPQFRY